ncbi:MAG: DUF885 domain-containing protein [Alphaproteobacteria bacterium]
MRLLPLILTATFSSALCLSACTPKPAKDQTREALVASESAQLNDWFEARYQDELARSPMTQTYFGMKDGQTRLDDASQLALDETAALQKSWLTEMKQTFDEDRLDPQSLLSYRLYAYNAEDALAAHGFSDHEYVFNHMSGPHSDLPSFMINFHAVETADDARAYIKRLEALRTYMNQNMARAEAQYDAGISLPAFVYPKLIQSSRNIIDGAPFTDGPDSPLFADFKSKVSALELGGEEGELITAATQALKDHVAPAYADMIAMFERHASGASTDDGAWKLPNGDTYYAARLKHYTTTDLTADDIHALGLKEVARIQDEMRVIMKQVGFEGTLQEFFTHLRTDPQFTYANDAKGREAYITAAAQYIDEMKGKLDSLFITKPKADMIVKRVEPFREDTAGGAFYDLPALDGSRPGAYYINLRDMSELPIYQMQALAYHEGIPGHHMQLAIALELQDLPKFRTMSFVTSYVEGWGLYSESVPKELGLYTDPYQDFGRLSMEIFRAARLVLDTGIHAKKWTREEAVTYMMENTANSEGDIRAEIDRYIVWPGQSTAYKIGMLKIVELRKKAEADLGEKFDIREFHDVVLANGAVPLTVLEELVEAWVAGKG